MRHITVTCYELARTAALPELQRHACCSSCHADADMGLSGMELARVELPCGCAVATCCLHHGTIASMLWRDDELKTLTDVLHKCTGRNNGSITPGT